MNDPEVEKLLDLMRKMQETQRETMALLDRVTKDFSQCSKVLQALTVQNGELRQIIQDLQAKVVVH